MPHPPPRSRARLHPMNPAPNRRGVTVQGNSPGPDEPAGRSSGQVVAGMETEAIICKYNPMLFISHRRACLYEIIDTYRDRIPDDFIDWLYSGEVDLWTVDGIETALLKLEKIIGKTIITQPETDDP